MPSRSRQESWTQGSRSLGCASEVQQQLDDGDALREFWPVLEFDQQVEPRLPIVAEHIGGGDGLRGSAAGACAVGRQARPRRSPVRFTARPGEKGKAMSKTSIKAVDAYCNLLNWENALGRKT